MANRLNQIDSAVRMASRLAEVQAEIQEWEFKLKPMAETVEQYEAMKRAQNRQRIAAAKTDKARFDAKYKSVVWETEHAFEAHRAKTVLEGAKARYEELKAERARLLSWRPQAAPVPKPRVVVARPPALRLAFTETEFPPLGAKN